MFPTLPPLPPKGHAYLPSIDGIQGFIKQGAFVNLLFESNKATTFGLHSTIQRDFIVSNRKSSNEVEVVLGARGTGRELLNDYFKFVPTTV